LTAGSTRWSSPDYLERSGVPVDFIALVDQDCLGFKFRRTIASWPIADGSSSAPSGDRGSPTIARRFDAWRFAGVVLARFAEFLVRAGLTEGRPVAAFPQMSPR